MKPDGIWGNVFRLGQKKRSLGDVLHEVPLFAQLTPKELSVLEHSVHNRTYKPGEAVFVESEPGAGMYVILSGQIDVVLHHQNGTPLLLASLEPGDFFGEMALLGDVPRSATAISRDRSELIGFFHPDLVELMSLHPTMGAKVAFGLAKTLAERLRYTNNQLSEVWEIRGQHETSR